MSVVGGTPRWAVGCAWATLWCVVPSGLWRCLVGVGVPMGWSAHQLAIQNIPGSGTVYVFTLTVLSVLAASLTQGLIRPWGERLPGWLPLLGGRSIPRWLVVGLAVLGAFVVVFLCVQSIVHWPQVSGFADHRQSTGAIVMIICYAPALLWAPLLLATTVGYLRRRRAS